MKIKLTMNNRHGFVSCTEENGLPVISKDGSSSKFDSYPNGWGDRVFELNVLTDDELRELNQKAADAEALAQELKNLNDGFAAESEKVAEQEAEIRRLEKKLGDGIKALS